MVALNHLPEFTSVFIDNSSTCFALAERMDFSYKTVVTNGLQVASRLANRKNIELILLGGTVRYNTNATHGGFSFSMLNSLRFDLMLSGAASIDTDGAYERSLDTTDIKKAVFLRSKQKMLVVGKSKFELKYPYRVAELADYDAICTDSKTPTVEKLKEKGIQTELHIGQGLNHVYPAFPIPEADEAIRIMCEIIERT